VEPLRVGVSLVHRERRLAELLAGREHERAGLEELVEDAALLGSLELAGCAPTWDEVRASRAGEAPPAVAGLRRARAAVERQAPLTRRALLAWHASLGLEPAGFRRGARAEGRQPAGAPAEFVASRLELLESWLAEASGADLQPAQAGALALARLCEIAPFEDGNGRVARLAPTSCSAPGRACRSWWAPIARAWRRPCGGPSPSTRARWWRCWTRPASVPST